MLSFGQVKCFSCGKKVKKKKAFTAVIQTGEGEHVLQMCERCGNNFDEIAKEYEEMLNETTHPI